MHFIQNLTGTLSVFPCGRAQHERRIRSSIAIAINSVLKLRFMLFFLLSDNALLF